MATVDVQSQQLLIGGEWRGASAGATYQTANPYTGEPATTAAAASPDDARAAVDAAAAALPAWSALSAKERAGYLNAAAELLMERMPEIAAHVTEETGGTFGWGAFNTELAAGMLHAAGEFAADVEEPDIPSHIPGKKMRAVRQPAGVVVGIAPWNAPVILGTRAVAAPLAHGNTVVLKASEECPRTHGAIVRALVDAGIPNGVVNLVTNAPEDAPAVVDALIAHPATRRVNFTGSTRVGKLIAQNAAGHLKRVLLELGGKAPMLVLDDADIDRAVAAANFGAFMHTGQICMSTERIVIDKSVCEEFATQLAERAGAMKVGAPHEDTTMIGPLLNKASVKRVGELVDDAVAKGAQLLTGGKADGPLYQPTVLLGVTPEMRIYHEESFGPVASIVVVEDVDDAVRVANDTDYGLAASVFTNDVDRGLDIATRIESGMCHINDSTVHDEPQAPFGGVKESGWGRFGGTAALEEFTELRWITVQEEPRQYPI
jgi:acyl-CoA reductase-like NAD-dependent aldehyde dehydrogenase